MNFADVTKLVIPQGEVIRIQDSLSRILWEKPLSIPPYFYIEDLSGQSNTITIKKLYVGTAPTITVEKSTDGVNWTSMGASSPFGISATIPANGRLYLRCNATTWSTGGQPNCIESSGNVKVGGNIMSLLYGSNFTGNETTFPSGQQQSRDVFRRLFANCDTIIRAGDLVLPVIELTEYCYAEMFKGCTSLTTAPVLPATILARGCYESMFYDCPSLTTAPELPAATLARGGYAKMFYGCTSLTTAPVLPATTLADSCYDSMFGGCTALSEVKCLATDISVFNCLYNWLYNVAVSGTFYKKTGVAYQTGVNGIPEGWTVVDV